MAPGRLEGGQIVSLTPRRRALVWLPQKFLDMPNIASAAKRARQTKTRTHRNRVTKSLVRSSRKRVLAAVDGKDAGEAETALRGFASEVDRAAKRGVLHHRTAARLKGRMSRAVQAVGKSAE